MVVRKSGRIGSRDPTVERGRFNIHSLRDERRRQWIHDGSMDLEPAHEVVAGEKGGTCTDGRRVRELARRRAEEELRVVIDGQRHGVARPVLDGDHVRGRIHPQHVTLGTEPHAVERRARPDSGRDERAVLLVASSDADVLTRERGGFGREVHDSRDGLRVDVVEERTARCIGENRQGHVRRDRDFGRLDGDRR